VTERTLDWTQHHDPRSAEHTYTAYGRRPAKYDRVLGPVLDQGQVGACTGFGSTAALSSRHPRLATNEHAMAVYELASSRDDFAGDWPTADNGSSVNAAMKALRDIHRVRSWDWIAAPDVQNDGPAAVDHAMDAIANVGPCVIGSPWYESMFDPAADGSLTIDTTEKLEGGHCFCLYGYESGYVLMRNSWGVQWGTAGDAMIPRDGLAALVGAGAEIAVAHVW
jgi:hypothetical protein